MRKGQTMMYKTLQRKLKIEQHKLHNQGRELKCCRAAPAPKKDLYEIYIG